MPDVDHSRYSTARKDYKCICGGIIKKGTRYWRHRELNQGEWTHYICHVECMHLHDERMEPLDHMIEQMEEALFEWDDFWREPEEDLNEAWVL